MKESQKTNNSLKNLIGALQDRLDSLQSPKRDNSESVTVKSQNKSTISDSLITTFKSLFYDSNNIKALDRITHLTKRVTQSDFTAIYFVNGEKLHLKSSDFGNHPSHTDIEQLERLTHRVRKENQVLFVDGVNQSGMLTKEESSGSLSSFAGVPLFTGKDFTIGILCCAKRNSHHWDDTDKANLADLSNMIMTEFQLALDIAEKNNLQKLVEEISRLAKIGGWEYDVGNNKLFLSKGAVQIHRLNRDESYSLNEILDQYPLKYRIELYKACLRLIKYGEPFNEIMHIYLPDGSRAWLSVFGNRVLKNEHVTKIRGAVQDISETQRSQNIVRNYADGLHALNEIFSNSDLSYCQQIKKGLDIVASFLEMPVGIVSRIYDEKFQIEYLVNNDARIKNVKEKSIYKLKDTYSELMYRENKLIVISDLQHSRYKSHPSPINYKFNTYIGVPIERDGEVYGTLSFSSIDKRQKPFTEQEKEFVQVFGKWIGTLIERRESKQNLEKSLKQISDYKHALDESAIVEMTDPYGNFIYMNDKFCEISGYTREELMPGNYDLIKSGKHPESFYKDLWETISNGEVWKGEICNRSKQGELYWIDTTIIPFLNEHDQPYQYISVSIDITSRKRAENALKHSEQRFRNVFENAAVGIALIDYDGIILRCNPALEEMLGYNNMELKGTDISEISHPDDVKAHILDFSQLIDGKLKKLQIEKRYIRKNGNLMWGKLTTSIIQNEEFEDDSYAIDMVVDITKQKEMEIALRKREKQYRDLFENAIEGIYQSTKDGHLIAVNPAMATILGYNTTDELKQKVSHVGHQLYVSEDDRKRLLQKLEENRVAKNFRTQLYKKDGSAIWVSISTRYLKFDNGEEIMEGTLQDITQQKMIEKRLHEAKDSAEEANRSKSEFLANVSHEIRTPMNAVLGFTDILTEIETDAQKKQYLNAINSSGKNLLNLINDILDLSKIEAGKMKLEYHVVNFINVLDEIENIFSLKMKEKDLKFSSHIDSEVPNGILIDEIRIRQVLLNLVGNAIKFTDEGEISINIKLTSKINYDSDSASLEIQVSDTGIGIPKDQKELIFQSFQQQSGQSNRKYGGTGLGLTISRRLVEKMGGKLTLESEVGVGSTFIINLKDIAIAAFDEPLDTDSGAKAPIIFKETLVLVVDDVKLNNALIREYLKTTGLETIEAENGQEAVDLVRKHRPAIVLMDLKMPVMDGFEATQILKSDPSTSNIPIVALTASLVQTDNKDFDRNIFDAFLEKPINKKALTDELAKFLDYHLDYIEEYGEQITTPNKKGKENVEFPNHLSEHKEEFLEEIKGDLWSEWEKLNHTLIIGKVQNFIDQLVDIDKRYKIELFKDYTDELQSAANRFDVTTLTVSLHKYPNIVTSIEEKM